MGDVIDLEERREAEKPFWIVYALCLNCFHRWVGTVPAETSLFKLQCPRCSEFNSFASFPPPDYVEAVSALSPPDEDPA